MKLFKKISAAILAGVMALSMVACGATGTTDPSKDTPAQDTPASSSAVTDVLKWMNNKRGTNEYGTETKLIENDAKLAKKAEILLNATAADMAIKDNQTIPVGTVAGVKDTFTVDRTTTPVTTGIGAVLALAGADQLDLSKEAVYMIGDKNITKVSDANSNPKKVTVDLSGAFKLDETTKKKLEVNGAKLTVKGDSTDDKVGIASKTIEGKTYVVIITTSTTVDFTAAV